MFDKQLIRCSALGRVMKNDRSNKAMGETAKSYLEELYNEVVFGIRKNFMSKHIEKGLQSEEAAIAFLSDLHGEFYTKNDEYRNNQFICGTADIITDNCVRDIKCSWDASTFPFHDKELPNKEYFYQLHGYMFLWDLDTAYVDYVLINTPDRLVEDEKRRAAWNIGATTDLSPEYLELCAEIDKQHNFDHIPKERRVRSFEIKRDEQVIESIKTRILEAREYLKSL